MAKKTDHTEDRIVAIEEALGRTEQFIEDNQRKITIVIGVIVLLVLGYFGFQRFYLGPREKDAQAQIFMAEKYFEQDSLDLALNGDGNYYGFLDVAKKYKMTKTSSLAHYYAGICYLRKGEYQLAIDHLESFDGDDVLVEPMAIGAIGDAYMELGNTDKAIKYYLEAAALNPNDITTPSFLMKAAWTYESLQQFDKAIEMYERVMKEHPRSQDSRDIEKYIARARALKS